MSGQEQPSARLLHRPNTWNANAEIPLGLLAGLVSSCSMCKAGNVISFLSPASLSVCNCISHPHKNPQHFLHSLPLSYFCSICITRSLLEEGNNKAVFQRHKGRFLIPSGARNKHGLSLFYIRYRSDILHPNILQKVQEPTPSSKQSFSSIHILHPKI